MHVSTGNDDDVLMYACMYRVFAEVIVLIKVGILVLLFPELLITIRTLTNEQHNHQRNIVYSP